MRARQQGFTLIEALIAFVILSVGLLGIVSLQALSKTSQHEAIQRARAVSLADAMIERVRINPAGVQSYIDSNPLGGDPNSPEPSPNCQTLLAEACDPNQIAEYDLWLWERALVGTSVQAAGANAGGLAEARGCITFDSANSRLSTGTLNVTIQWRGLQETRDAVQAGETVCGGGAAGTNPNRRQISVNTFVFNEDDL
tara:strand:- start:27619 stop:28212 length:594 start_codon:yes stop_codon:yes gene_type:complete